MHPSPTEDASAPLGLGVAAPPDLQVFGAEAAAAPADGRAEVRSFVRRAAAFVAVGLLLYGAVYGGAERLARRMALRNRFAAVQAAAGKPYDYVILGASHAAVFDYRDMNARLERMTGAHILNLATVGGGVSVNRLLLDYFFSEGSTGAVVYVLDSFGVYSRAWNEERLHDRELYARAPWDPGLALLLLRDPAARAEALDYITGFSKINNPNRFEPDLFEAEGQRFDRTYRRIAQVDRQRIAYLYPDGTGADALRTSPYLAELEGMMDETRARGARFLVVRPPVPARMRQLIPGEDEFDATIREVAARHGAELYDFSRVDNDESLFYDSDHLNRAGVLNFYEHHLAPLLAAHRAPAAGGER